MCQNLLIERPCFFFFNTKNQYVSMLSLMCCQSALKHVGVCVCHPGDHYETYCPLPNFLISEENYFCCSPQTFGFYMKIHISV